MKINKIIGTYGSNTYVVGNDKDVVIIDSGATLDDVKAEVGTRKVHGVLITHEHFDHLTNSADYARAFNTEIYCSREVLTHLEYFNPTVYVDGNPYDIGQIRDDVKVNIIWDETELSLGGITIQPYWMPGHSYGSFMYKVGDDIFTGDVLFTRGIGRTDIMTGGKKHMAQTLKRLADMKFTTAYHGHGDPSTYNDQHRNIIVFAKWLGRNKS